MTPTRPRSVACPICGADTGRHCTQADGSLLPWRASHDARVTAAQQRDHDDHDDHDEQTGEGGG